MSDYSMPAWAEALEQRLTVQAEAMEHRIITEVGKAIADSEARLNRRFDQIRDDLSVAMARADRVDRRIEQEHDDIRELRGELSKVWRRLRDVEHRLGLNGGQGGTQPGPA